MSAEMLARLAPKIVNLGSFGYGHGDLTPLDLAGALAGLPPGPYYLSRVAWIDDIASWQRLIDEVQSRLRRGSPCGCPNWEGVIALAVAEYCWPPSCRDCAGRGEIKKKEYYGVCMACHGSGYGRVPIASLADNCGVSSEEWKRTWAPRYEKVYRLCCGWGATVLEHLRERLSD